jgi:hypothetical protein
MQPKPNHKQGRQCMPPVPQTGNHSVSHALHYFITLQNQHITRLQCLFPEINPAALKKLLGKESRNYLQCSLPVTQSTYSMYSIFLEKIIVSSSLI